MNRNSNVYTVVYAAVMVIVVAAVLAFTALTLRPAQAENVMVEKQRQILNSINVASTAKNASELYSQYITESFVVDLNGQKVAGDAFKINVKSEYGKPEAARLLPVFVSNLNGETKYVLPLYGMGLWGPLWGYVSVNADGNTLFGAIFDHQAETAGLGAEITKASFSDQFKGKHLFSPKGLVSVAVLKVGQKVDAQDSVDAISGGTITSHGVQDMLLNCLKPYENFLKSLQ